MISTNNVSLSFGGRKLFDEVNLKLIPGNCYGLIGANGAGKSTFLKLLAGELDPQTGKVEIQSKKRLSVLKQNHFEFDEFTVMDTVLRGHKELYAIMQQKDAIYAKSDFSDEDGVLVAELEARFAELNGWETESQAAIILDGLGIATSDHQSLMKNLSGPQKVKILLASALIGQPDILLLDEPTNHLDIAAIYWLEDFLSKFENTVMVVSHDRHFLNQVCTHIADIDFGKITVYTGNYDFWRKSSELAMKLRGEQNKRNEDKATELKAFIARFSANASKSKQATSRKNMLEKLELKDLPLSTRKYPYIHFAPTRESGKDLLKVENLSYSIDGVKILDRINFQVKKGDKICFLSPSSKDQTLTTLFRLLVGELTPDSGTITWGVTTTRGYFPVDNSQYFSEGKYNLVEWLRQYAPNNPDQQEETFLRGFLGKMLFSGEEALKKTNVLSGGEKVRCMLSKLMLSGSNVLMMDGPTNHLDLESITALNEGLMRFSGTLLFTSHDHEFIQTVADRLIEVDTKITYDNYSTYDDFIKNNVGNLS